MRLRSTGHGRIASAVTLPPLLLAAGYLLADPAISTFAHFKYQFLGKSSSHARVVAGDAAAKSVPLSIRTEPLFRTSGKAPRADRYLDIKTTQVVERGPRVMMASLVPGDVMATGALAREAPPPETVQRDGKAGLLLTDITFGHAMAARFQSGLWNEFEEALVAAEKARIDEELAAMRQPKVARNIAYQGETEAEYQERQRRCLATAIYFESRGEPIAGQKAVAQVIMNRMRSPDYPDTICGVVYQGSQRRTGCQFSFTCDGKPETPRDMERWRLANDLATKVTTGEVWLDDIGHATHFHATYVRPRWIRDMNRVQRIGQHIFYRIRNERPYDVPDLPSSPSPDRGLALSGSG